MPLDYIDVEKGKAKSSIDLERENADLKTRLDEMDSALFEMLMKESEPNV